MARLNHVKSFRGTSKTADGNLTCGKCGATITKGDSYRWWSNRSPGMRSGIERYRCAKTACTPSMGEMTPGRRGQLYLIQENAEAALAEWAGDNTDDLESIWENAADELRELAEEFRESASNIEDGFGHATYQSEEMEEKGDSLEGVADDAPDFEDPPEREDFEDDEAPEAAMPNQNLSLQQSGQEKYEEALEAWREEQRTALTEKLYEAEV